jgi:hypothetical protein
MQLTFLPVVRQGRPPGEALPPLRAVQAEQPLNDAQDERAGGVAEGIGMASKAVVITILRGAAGAVGFGRDGFGHPRQQRLAALRASQCRIGLRGFTRLHKADKIIRQILAHCHSRTPDARLDAAVAAAVVSLDQVRDGKAWLEGVTRWNTRWANKVQITELDVQKH